LTVIFKLFYQSVFLRKYFLKTSFNYNTRPTK